MVNKQTMFSLDDKTNKKIDFRKNGKSRSEYITELVNRDVELIDLSFFIKEKELRKEKLLKEVEDIDKEIVELKELRDSETEYKTEKKKRYNNVCMMIAKRIAVDRKDLAEIMCTREAPSWNISPEIMYNDSKKLSEGLEVEEGEEERLKKIPRFQPD